MKEYTNIEKSISELVDNVSKLKVTNASSYEIAAAELKLIKALKKEVCETFDPIIKKQHEAHKESIAQKKKYLQPLDEVEKLIKNQIVEFHKEEEKKRIEEQKRLEEKAQEEQIQKAIDAEQSGAVKESEQILDQPTIPPPPTPLVKSKGISQVKKWSFEIQDESKIPRKFLTPDVKKIRQYVTAMGADAEIEGVRIFESTSVSVRA